MRGVWLSLLGCAVVASASHAGAAPLVVDWQAPACAGEAAFRSRVRDALQREAEVALEQELKVSVTIREEPEQRGFSLQIRMESGARQLELPSCDEAVAAAATFVALTIDPNATPASAAAPAEEPAPVVTTPPPRTAAPAPKLAPPPAARPAERYAAVFAGAALGEVPATSPLVGATVGLRLRALAFGAEGFWIAPKTELVPGTTKGGSIGLWGGGVAACYLSRQPPLRLSGCLGAQAGAWHSRGVGVGTPTEQNDWWLAGLGRLGASLALTSSLGLYLAADVVVPARRPWFGVANLGRVFRPKPVSERLSGGVELNF